MKKLGVTLLAVAFSLPIFARTQAPANSGSTSQTQTKTRKGKSTAKHSKRRHSKKTATSMAKPTQSTPATK